MSVLNDLDGIRKAVAGERVTKVTANLPQTTTGNLFNVVGGRVLLLQIVGEVTAIIQTQANNTKLVHNPTIGAAADLCAVLDVSAKAVGTLFGVTGTVANAMVGASHAYLVSQNNSFVLPVGSIGLDCAASNTGQVKWDVLYIPLDSGAYIEAV